MSGSAGGALLLLGIVTLLLLDDATLGAAWLVTGAMWAAAPSAVRAAAAELDASVSDAAPALFCSASGLAGDAPLLLEIEALSLLEGATLGAVRLVFGACCTGRCAGRCPQRCAGRRVRVSPKVLQS